MIRLILRFSWRNIWRNRRRTLLTLSAITIGMISLIFGRGYIAGAIQAMLEPGIRLSTGHIRLAHPEYLRLERTLPKERLIRPLGQIMKRAASLPGISSQHPQLRFRALAVHEGNNEPCQVLGIDAAADNRHVRLGDFITQGAFLTEGPDSLVIGRGLAEKLMVGVGDELLLVASDINYATYALPFRISGILSIGISGLDRNGILIHLDKAAQLLDAPDAAHELLLFCKDRNQAPDLADSLRHSLKDLPGLEVTVAPWQENDMVRETLPLVQRAWGSILLILMMLVGLVILNTMLMTVMERYREIGILKALGLKNREVVAMIFCESAILGTLGTLVGGILGTVLTLIAARTGIDMGQAMNPEIFAKAEIPISFIGSTLRPVLTPAMVMGAVIFGIVTALAAVLYPAMKARAMSPVDAFRTDLKV
jgi:ABC-type lipoprotein release transport system permease subunit